jgi:hypothetical protein
MKNKPVIAALKSVRENSVVPPGLKSLFPLFPALKRWAKLGRPSGAEFPFASFHPSVRKQVFTHTLKRCSIQTKCNIEKWPDHFFSQVFPVSALFQISWLLVEITTSAGSRTSM